jgi:Oxidoreductase family, NAD-binding Rossmann fold
MSEPQSASPEVRIGILGSGWMGSVHAECYPRIKGVKVVGVFSRNLERAKTAAKICDAKAVGDASALLDDPDVDAIDVCLPSVNHEEFVAKALERGKHVFCETPFALTFTEAEAMLKAAKEADRIFMVGLLVHCSIRIRTPSRCSPSFGRGSQHSDLPSSRLPLIVRRELEALRRSCIRTNDSGLRLHPLVDRLANLGLCNRGRMGSWSTRRDLGNLELRFRRQCNGHRERHHAEGISFLNRFQSSV